VDVTEFWIMVNRVMVGLPSVESREKILRTLLSKEKVEDIDFKELAAMTEGYSGSDLKVCTFTKEIMDVCF
jgi:ATP-dependent Zn protease